MAFMLRKRVMPPGGVVAFTVHLQLNQKHRCCPTEGQSHTITTITSTRHNYHHHHQHQQLQKHPQ
jgi:hypothetical protein